MITNENNKSQLMPFLKYGVLSLLMMALLFAGALTVNASNSTSCFDVVGQGMDVDYEGTGVFNSGKPIFDFIVPNVAPGYAYQSCLEDPEGVGFPHAANAGFGAPGSPYWQVKGWTWNDNLGWISMYCSGGLNEGIACGPYDYGVTIDENGNFYGYAWGDNTGWISFYDTILNYHRVKINVDIPECQGYVYGPTTNPAPGICPPHTKIDTMAWSDNVGWMDFDGVIFPWYQITEMLTDDQVIVTLVPDPYERYKMTVNPALKAPFADGTDPYTVEVTILDKDGQALEEPRYETVISLIWTRDTVKKDQRKVAVAQLLASLDACTDHPNRAVSKPCIFNFAEHYLGGGSGVWRGLITSVAPTSNMNKKLSDGDGEILVDYEKFIVPGSMLTNPQIESNDLVLAHVDIFVRDTVNDLCVYGDVYSCAPIDRGFNDPPVRDRIMKFLPQTEIITLDEEKNINFIDVMVNERRGFSIDGYKKAEATVTLHGGIDPVSAGLKMVFDLALGNEELEWSMPSTQDVSALLGEGMQNFVAGVVQHAGQAVAQYLKGLHIYSVVDEGGGVYYYSNKLPRVVGSTGVQPVAILRGAVYSLGAVTTTTTQGDPIRSLGEISTNLLRDQVFRNVSGLIAGVQQPISGVPVTLVEGQGFLLGGFQTGTGSIVNILKDEQGVPKVYYARGDIHVGSAGDINPLTWTGERTIVTIGGNIYIDADLYNAVASPRPKLGLIALKDLTSNTAAAQGHVYIHDKVNNVQANIFADGSVFTYHTGAAFYPADGRPVYVDEDAYREVSEKYQLFIEGSVASQNTIGGATRQPRIDGLGQPVTDILRAKQYDLNFLRMYTGMIKRDPVTGGALDGNEDPVASEADLKIMTPSGVPWSKYLLHNGVAGDLYPPGEIDAAFMPAEGLSATEDLGSTYIFYDPPSPTLPGFQGASEFDFSLRAGG